MGADLTGGAAEGINVKFKTARCVLDGRRDNGNRWASAIENISRIRMV